jgi:hypothetical protein
VVLKYLEQEFSVLLVKLIDYLTCIHIECDKIYLSCSGRGYDELENWDYQLKKTGLADCEAFVIKFSLNLIL